MRFPALIGCTLTAAVMLAGCSGGGSQGPTNIPSSMNAGSGAQSMSRHGSPSLAGTLTAAHPGAILTRHNPIPDKGGKGDVYVSDYGANVLYGYKSSGGSPIFTASSGISGPQGLAATKTNVYVANTNDSQNLVYTPPSTTATSTITDTGFYPAGVAVNKKGTNIWVSNICSAPSCTMGNLEEYSKSGALLQSITCSDLYRYYFVAVDKKGNVAVDGEDESGLPHVDLVPAGSTSCTALTAISIEFPGGVQFTDKGDLGVDDQEGLTVTTWTAPGFTSKSSTTTLGGGISDPVTFAFVKRDPSLWTANAGSGDATEFAYPAGGSPSTTITGIEEPIGVAVVTPAKA